jgi:hypothetical protein
MAEALSAEGFTVFAVEPSPRLTHELRSRLPAERIDCDSAQASGFFGRSFDAAIAIGLLFLLPEPEQEALIKKIAAHLLPGGHFLFSAPEERVNWMDLTTDRESRSLGRARYCEILEQAGLRPTAQLCDEGGNAYHAARKGSGSG